MCVPSICLVTRLRRCQPDVYLMMAYPEKGRNMYLISSTIWYTVVLRRTSRHVVSTRTKGDIGLIRNDRGLPIVHVRLEPKHGVVFGSGCRALLVLNLSTR
jgi:hypothetical protein